MTYAIVWILTVLYLKGLVPSLFVVLLRDDEPFKKEVRSLWDVVDTTFVGDIGILLHLLLSPSGEKASPAQTG